MNASTTGRIRQATPLVATLLFFVLGFAFDGWAWAWLVFLVVPIVYVFLRPDKDDGNRQQQ